jgi:hypothetical protein
VEAIFFRSLAKPLRADVKSSTSGAPRVGILKRRNFQVMTPRRRVYLIAINLLNRVDRRKRVINLFQQIQSSCQGLFEIIPGILEACDGVTQSLSELNNRYGVTAYPNWALTESGLMGRPPSWRLPQLSGGIASTMSHLDAISLAHDRGWLERRSPDEPQPILLVAKDDISLFGLNARSFLEQLAMLLSEGDHLVPDWDMMLFGASESRGDISKSQPLSENLEIAGFSYLTTLFAVTLGGVKKFRSGREIILRNCIVFDELHNALAGLTSNARPDLDQIYHGIPRVRMLSARRNLVRQEPKDCIHDTEVSACSRRQTAVDQDRRPPAEPELLTPYKIPVVDLGVVYWWRRSAHLQKEDLELYPKTTSTIEPQKLNFGFIWNKLQSA